MQHICNHQCRDGSECRSREACDMHDYSVRVIRPNGSPVEYVTRAASSMQAANDATQAHGLGCRVSARRAAP